MDTLERNPLTDRPPKTFFSAVYIWIRRPWAKICNRKKKGDTKENDSREE
jgi:hypothetical protein